MSNVNVSKMGSESMADNPSRVDVADYTSGFREFKPHTERSDWRVIIARTLVGLFAFLILWMFYGIWKTAYCWTDRNYAACDAINGAEPYILFLLLLAFAGVALWRTVAFAQVELRQRRAYANRTNLVLNRFGNQRPADLYDRMTPTEMLNFLVAEYRMDVALKERTAPYEQYWGVNALSEAAPPALPPPTDAVQNGPDVGPLPVDRWLGSLTEAYHILLASETGGGKSTTARAILGQRINDGDQVLIIDPHYQPGSWFELPAVGGGLNWDEIDIALRVVLQEMTTRYEAYSEGQSDFDRLTIVIDEVPAIYDQLGDRWKQFAKQLGSQARKVNISTVLLTQSPLVMDIGVNTSMQRNFRRVALDAACIRTMLDRDELNRERRQQLAAMLSGRNFPATVEIDGQVWFLDRTGLDQLPEPRHSASAAWEEGYTAIESQSCARACVREDDETLLSELLRTNEQDKIAELRTLRSQGITRDRAREMGHTFTDSDWTKAR